MYSDVGLNPEMKTYSNIMMRVENSAIEFILMSPKVPSL